jgi:hypothetical protein
MSVPTSASAVVPKTPRRITASQKRFLIGGLGALLPSLLYLLTLDFEAVFSKLTPPVVLGVLVKTIVLCVVGGAWAYFHAGERSQVKLAEFGMLAPAIISGLVSGYAAKVAPEQAFISTPVAYAQTVQREEQIQQFLPPEESAQEQFLRGLTGQRPTRVWFVIVSSHPTLEEARSAARVLGERGLLTPGFEADVYAPSGGYPSHAVVTGAHLTLSEAEDLRQRAIAAGFPMSTQVWRLAQ